MKKLIPFALSFLILGFVLIINRDASNFNLGDKVEVKSDKKEKDPAPNKHWLEVRSYPNGFDQETYKASISAVKARAHPNTKDAILSSSWVQEGPGNIGGRFNTLASPSSDPNIIYAGAANGGIFKTTNGGTSWNPIFDDFSYLAIGDIAIDPFDEQTIYVGTGDKNFGGGSFLGDGVYRSKNGGNTWVNIGLQNIGIVTKVEVDPTDNTRIFVSTLGNPYEKTTERGLYRTENNGTSWENILFVSDSSGVIDFVINPDDPDIIYAAGFNRINLPFKSRTSGPDAKIFKSINGGDTWTELSNGLPSTEESRIGLAIAPSNPALLYAIYVDDETRNVKDVYKTVNGGDSWTALNVGSGGLPDDVLGGFGWYFGQIHINPYNENQLIIPGVDMYKSENGGNTWSRNVPRWSDYEVHADKHDVLYSSATSYIIATDGGLYKTIDNGVTWTDIENIPVTQFYHVDVDPENSGIYAGGAQDNGSTSGNKLALNNWKRLYGGDGFRVTYCTNPKGGVWYETQRGNIQYENNLTFVAENISPARLTEDRFNWDTPFIYNNETKELIAGGSKIWTMADAPYGNYIESSSDLTKAADGNFIGRLSSYTITELAQPLENDDILYIGTRSGLVWRGDRSGSTWNYTNITGTLPNLRVTGIRCSPNDENTVYVMYSGYTSNDKESYLYKSIDNGNTWESVSGNLPSAVVGDIAIVPDKNDAQIFAALDGGVFFTEDAGINWKYVGKNLPFVTVSELHFDFPNKKLIAGTYARSMWSYDISWITDEEESTASIKDNEYSLGAYPNPATEVLYLKNANNAGELYIYDLQGNIVISKPASSIINPEHRSIDISKLSAGTYLIKIGTSNSKFTKY